MLTLLGKPRQNCDRITRRGFLTAGAFGLGGIALADLLRAEAAAGIGSSNKAIVNIHLDGGPPQMDTIDLKPQAPAEIRGEFTSIATKLPGVRICELLPQMAALAERFVFIRSLVGAAGRHDAFQCQSGFEMKDLLSLGGRPALGCVVSKLRGTTSDTAPAFVDMMQGRALVRDSARPGFLGPSYKPFRPDMDSMFSRPLEPGMEKELANLGAGHTVSLKLHQSLDARRLSDRASLLSALDGTRRELDASGMMDAFDRFGQQAASILTSGSFADALDLSKEDPRIVERYLPANNPVAGRFTTADEPIAAHKLLLARRLIEAGVRCVSVSFSDFDTHSSNFLRMRQVLPIVDHALCTFIADLDQRGLLDDVTIVAWGEFGRTPKINDKAGRDHWPRVGPALLAGGGMRTGQVIGSTDRTASAATSRPVHYKDIFATLYHNLGLDPHALTITDPTGRPQYLLDAGERLAEVG